MFFLSFKIPFGYMFAFRIPRKEKARCMQGILLSVKHYLRIRMFYPCGYYSICYKWLFWIYLVIHPSQIIYFTFIAYLLRFFLALVFKEWKSFFEASSEVIKNLYQSQSLFFSKLFKSLPKNSFYRIHF